jgi:hypothetical protein
MAKVRMPVINTISDLLTANSTILDELKTIQAQIKENFKYITNPSLKSGAIQKEIQDMKNEQERYDTLFEEEESILQAMGGKTRMQTLQEFVLTFFYSGFFLFSVALAFYYYIRTGGSSKEIGIVLSLMVFIGLIVTAFLIRYA